MSKCESSNGKGNSSGGSAGGRQANPFARYGGGGDSSHGYERAGFKQFKAFTYASDLASGPIDRYALARELRLPGMYKAATPIDLYKPPKTNDPFGVDALYKGVEPNGYRNIPMKRTAVLETELEQRENIRRKGLA